MNNPTLLTITLPLPYWNAILNTLGQQPYTQVQPIIDSIKQQVEVHNARLAEPGVSNHASRPMNGIDHDGPRDLLP